MIIDLIVFIPVIAAVAIGLGAEGRKTALGAAAANLILGVIVISELLRRGGEELIFETSTVILENPKLTLGFAVDGMSGVLLLLTVIVTFCAVYISPEKAPDGKVKLYHISPLLISTGALGAFCSTDLFFLFAFHELALIPTFLMIGIYGHGRDKLAVAWKITIYLGVGSLVLLGGLIALYSNLTSAGSATFNIADLTAIAETMQLDQEVQKWIFLPLFLGFGILVSLFPFHSWAAPAYASAPTSIAMLHAGVLKKFGLYGILRVAMPMLPKGFEAWEGLILVLLLGNIIYVGFVTISQKYLDRMLGNSSVMHMGYAFLGIACVNHIGWNGAVLMMFAHGISIALLFALCGSLRERLNTLELSEIGGLASKVPFLAVSFGFAAFASIGLPGFANFASEITILFGAFNGAEDIGNLQKAAILALWGVVISAVYMLRAYRNVFQGDSAQGLTLVRRDSLNKIPIILMIVVLLLTGFFPNLILSMLPS
ncbi:MAG: NADH-quinone oxidoreductase subunit M [Verrucomicrobiales bacterium]|nr:NADH-quinone oxidoreductase subunit M [Verrucomicrobiales bacterium]